MGAKSSLFLIVFAHAGIRSFVEAFDDRLLESFEATDGGHIAEDASLWFSSGQAAAGDKVSKSSRGTPRLRYITDENCRKCEGSGAGYAKSLT